MRALPLHRSPVLTQPVTGILTGAAALLTLTHSYRRGASGVVDDDIFRAVVVTLVLVTAVVVAYHYPIHIRRKTKILLTSGTLLLMAVLLSPPLAATAAGSAKLIGELMVRRQRGTYPSDIATQVGRWILLVLLGSLIAHIPLTAERPHVLLIVTAALVLWAGDILTAPLLFVARLHESPTHIMVLLWRESAAGEGIQYVIGILVTLATFQTMWILGFFIVPTLITYRVLKYTKELDDGTREFLEHMADTVDLRDPYTGGHSRRVTALVQGILRELAVEGPEVDLVVAAARVHDIGKIGIPDIVLHKADVLSPDEWAVMQTHPDQGAHLLERYARFARVAPLVRHHHERWDGLGYPQKLKGFNIPFGARVIAVADSYDAMTSSRPYRAGMRAHEAIGILMRGRGVQWDPEIVDAFLASIAAQENDHGRHHLRLVSGATAREKHGPRSLSDVS